MRKKQPKEPAWDTVIRPDTLWFDFSIKELWRYKDLIFLFVRRDFAVFYTQTILGPLWYLIQPLLTTIVFTVIFGKIAKIPTDKVDPFLFYFCGILFWNYFSNCLNRTAGTFTQNARTFGMVYFPRLSVPIAVVISNLMQFAVQLVLFLCFYAYFSMKGAAAHPTRLILYLPFLVLQMGVLGFGLGILVSSVTVKYRDLSSLTGFLLQLWMFVSPVIYPASSVDAPYRGIYMLNPLATIIETTRAAFLGKGIVDPVCAAAGWAVTLAILLVGIIVFDRTEKTFMDTI
jgi:lipopolysaccharide transport system permease protein